MQPLTKKQQLVLDLIRSYIQTERIPPTTREIADKLGVTQTCAMNYVSVLANKGWLTRQHNKSRSIVLVDENIIEDDTIFTA